MNLNDVGNDKVLEKSKPGSDVERKFIQISPESIELIADSAGYSDIARSVSASLAEDSSYRLRELIQSCVQILRHSKHPKLTKDDVNLALRWSDIPQLHGQDSQLVDFLYVPELDIYSTFEKNVDLTREYALNTDVEVYSPMKLSTLYFTLDSEEKFKTEIYTQYFEKISQSLLSTSDCVLEVALSNLQENSKLQPLLSALAVFLKNLVEFSHENCHIVKRIPSIFNSLMKNPHLNIEPEQKSFINLLENLLLHYSESFLDENVFHLVSNVSHILAKMCSSSSIHDVVNNLSHIIADADCSIFIQCRAMLALKCISSEHLDNATVKHWNALLAKIYQKIEEGEKTLYLEDILISAIVDVLRYRIGLLDKLAELNKSLFNQIWRESCEIYRLTKELLGSSVLRIGEFPPAIRRRLQEDRTSKKSNEACNELYWTVKSRYKPSSQSKWQYNQRECQYAIPRKIDLKDVFDYPEKKPHLNGIHFRVRNWKQRPMQTLKKIPMPRSAVSPSLFATLSNSKFKPFSKKLISNSLQYIYHPVEFIL